MPERYVLLEITNLKENCSNLLQIFDDEKNGISEDDLRRIRETTIRREDNIRSRGWNG
jgi:hypothetical protein